MSLEWEGVVRGRLDRKIVVGSQPRHLAEPSSVVSPETNGGSKGLRNVLVLTDFAASLSAWVLLAWLLGSKEYQRDLWSGYFALLVVPASTSVVIATNKLYKARQCVVRSSETAGLFRSTTFGGISAWLLTSKFPSLDWKIGHLFAGQLLSFLLLVAGRAAYRAGLHSARSKGRFLRPIVLVGAGDEGKALEELFRRQPGLGYSVIGIVGDKREANRNAFSCPYLGPIESAGRAAKQSGASGVVIASTAVSMTERNELIRSLLGNEIHVQISGGLLGMASNRLRPNPIGKSWAAFSLDPNGEEPWHERFRRAS
jgi:FlaA1/EpsC-like NDP-sugar epimerase